MEQEMTPGAATPPARTSSATDAWTQLAQNGGLAGPLQVLDLLIQFERSAPMIKRLLARLETLEASGALDTFFEILMVLHAARDSMTDGQVARVGDSMRTLVEFADALMTSGMTEKLPRLLESMKQAQEAALTDKGFLGPLDLLSAPREPEIQAALKFLLAFGRRLPAALKD